MAPTPTPIFNLTHVLDDFSNALDSMFVESTQPRYTSNSVLPPNTGGWGGWNLTTTDPYTDGSPTIDDIIRTIREKEFPNTSVSVFERAKKAFADLPNFPATDIVMDKDSGDLTFRVALPGYAEEDIDISFESDTMQIKVDKDNSLKKQKEEESSSKVYLRKSLKTSKVTLDIPIPFSRFNVREASAEYKNGLLTVTVPRNEDFAPHRIQLGKNKDQKSIEE